MSVPLSLFLEAYGKTWNMCLAFLVFFVVVAVAAGWIRVGKLDFCLPSRLVFWACLIPGFALMAICLTLIDKPHIACSEIAKEWLFMFSAFLGIPVALPFWAGAAWASAHRLRGEPVKASSLALLLLGMFALGCAASNIHDVAWCGAITSGYTQHYVAGYDLDYFVSFGNGFGITREVLADYATLGPCAVVLVLGELIVAVTCFIRLGKLQASRPSR